MLGAVPGTAEPFATSRVRVAAGAVAVSVAALAVGSAFAPSSDAGSIAYVVALGVSALVILRVAMDHPQLGSAWRLVGAGVAVWAVAGFLVVLGDELGLDNVPELVVSLLYAIGYVPLLIGLAEMCDPQFHVRRLTNVLDGVLLFLSLYAVLWLTVVEQVVVGGSLSKTDRAFSALYPAGDLAVVMLVVRVISSRSTRRVVGMVLLGGAALSVVADVALLVVYLHDPYGELPISDVLYVLGLGCFAVAAVWSLLPAPSPAPCGAATPHRLAIMVVVASLMPPLALVAIKALSDREVAMGPVAVWMLLVVLASVLRRLAGVKELDQVHQQAVWQAAHDQTTGLLHRSAFLHEVSKGGTREHNGIVMVVQALGLQELRDSNGYDAVDVVVGAMATSIRAAAGDNAVISRLAHDQFGVFMRLAGLAHGREVAAGLQRSFMHGVMWGDIPLSLPAAVGVAQADGAVIDVVGGLRRATEALHLGRARIAGAVVIDADLMVDADLIGTASSGAMENHTRHAPLSERMTVRPG